jgi:DNA primase
VAELAPFVRLVPEGLARTTFEDAVARTLELDAAALRAELAGARPPRHDEPPPDLADDEPPPEHQGRGEPAPRPPRRPFRPDPRGGQGAQPLPGSAARVRAVLPGAAADALGLLAAFPELGPVAEEEHLPGLLPAGPLADLARDLVREPLGLDSALARLASAADEPALRRIRALCGPGGVEKAAAERQLRRACVQASIEAVVAEQARLHALIAKQGSPVPEELVVKAQVAARRRSDLEKRLRTLTSPG